MHSVHGLIISVAHLFFKVMLRAWSEFVLVPFNLLRFCTLGLALSVNMSTPDGSKESLSALSSVSGIMGQTSVPLLNEESK